MSSSESTSKPTVDSGSVYNLSLFFAFWANVFQLISLSLLFRYSDFVKNLNGTEFDLGMIVGMATIGAILFRIVQGVAIDSIGPKAIWIVSIILQLAALCWHIQLTSIQGWEVYFARGLFAMGLAGSFSSWLSFISLQSPVHRIAEVIGVVGSSGFVGMAIGPILGDRIFSTLEVTRDQVESMFYWSSTMIGIALVFAVAATRSAKSLKHGARAKNRITSKTKKRNPLKVLLERRPGLILLVGLTMGITIGFPGNYLRPMAESLGILKIQTFFIVYNVTAFVARLTFRRTPQTLGLRNTITLGFAFFFVSFILFMFIQSERGFWLPAIIGGLGHSFLFPSVIAACTNRFEKEDRGLATNLILAMYDMGVFVGMPIIGKVVTVAPDYNLSPYPSVLTLLCGFIFVVSTIYFVRKRD